MITTFQELIKEISVRAWNSPCRKRADGSSRIPVNDGHHDESLTPYCVFSPFYRKPDKLVNQFGLRHLTMPHPDVLTGPELKRLVRALTELWIAWNLIPEFPDETPEKTRYTLLRDYLEREMPIPSVGSIHIHFDRRMGSREEAA